MNHILILTAIVTSLFISSTNLFAMAKSTDSNTGSVATNTSIHLVEEAAQALVLAAQNGVYNATVLHIDNSDDLWPVPTDKQISTAKTLLHDKSYKALETSGRALVSGTERLFSYINHLVMAHRLGLIKEVYWAVPSLEAFDLAQLQQIMSYPANRSTPFAANTGTNLKIAMPKITGTISGVPVTIGLLRHFKTSKAPLWVDIELDYFTELYKNPVSSSYLSLLSGFVSAHQKLELDPLLTTITYGNLDGQLAISNRYLGQWLRTMLKNPAIIDGKPPAAWVSKNEALYQDFFIQYDDAITEYGKVLQAESNNPDAHYSIGIMLIKKGQYNQAYLSLDRARQLDQTYLLGFIDAKQQLTPETPGEIINKVDLALTDESSQSHLPLRTLAVADQASGNHSLTVERLNKLIASGDDSPLIKAMVGESLEETGQLSEAIKAYQMAIDTIRNSQQQMYIPKLWINLGKALEKEGNAAEAKGVYLEYLDYYANDKPENIDEVSSRLKKLEE